MSGSNDEMKMADSLLAFVLLDNSGITEEGKKLAFTALNTQGISLKNMKSALIRVFSNDSGHGLDTFADCKMEIKQEALYTSKRKSYSGFPKFNSSKFKSGSNSASVIKYNPRNQYGQITRCSYCDATMHYKKQCQHRHLFRHLEDVNINESCSEEEDSSEESVNIVLMAQEVSPQEIFVAETYKCAVVDTACSKTVGGTKWVESFVNSLSESNRKKVLCEPSKTTFKFGDGRKVKSHCIVRIPVQIGDVHCSIDAEVVDENIPLLMSKSSLKKAGTIINTQNDTARMFDQDIPLHKSSVGHYCVEIFPECYLTDNDDKDEMELANVLMLFEDKSPAKKKADIVKLHRQFGHSSTNNLKKLLRNANLLNKELENLIDIVVKECEVCC